MELEKYGIFEGINEVIVTTLSVDGRPNAAPIGLMRHDAVLTVRIYNGSQSGINIKANGLMAANIVDDPVLFVRSALSDLDENMYEFVETGNGIKFPLLGESDAWMLFRAEHIEGRNAITAKLQPVEGSVKRNYVRSVNRGFCALIEALIQATRYKVFNDEKYLTEIKSYESIIKKCGGSQEKSAYELIFKLL